MNGSWLYFGAAVFALFVIVFILSAALMLAIRRRWLALLVIHVVALSLGIAFAWGWAYMGWEYPDEVNQSVSQVFAAAGLSAHGQFVAPPDDTEPAPDANGDVTPVATAATPTAATMTPTPAPTATPTPTPTLIPTPTPITELWEDLAFDYRVFYGCLSESAPTMVYIAGIADEQDARKLLYSEAPPAEAANFQTLTLTDILQPEYGTNAYRDFVKAIQQFVQDHNGRQVEVWTVSLGQVYIRYQNGDGAWVLLNTKLVRDKLANPAPNSCMYHFWNEQGG